MGANQVANQPGLRSLEPKPVYLYVCVIYVFSKNITKVCKPAVFFLQCVFSFLQHQRIHTATNSLILLLLLYMWWYCMYYVIFEDMLCKLALQTDTLTKRALVPIGPLTFSVLLLCLVE